MENKLDRFVENCFESLYETYKKRVIEIEKLTEAEYMQNEAQYKKK